MDRGRKISGGKYHKQRKKKKYEMKGNDRVVKLADRKTKTIRGRGGGLRTVSLSQNTINITKNGKGKIAKIKNVIETPSNRFLARQNVIVKGAIVDTDMGKARVTNRPTQEGHVQGVLVE
ncbi:30S ribosomal protein S8e [Candidatus Pacearchaeota archaeon]|nr:30S ribosomal protein S8e [Candidatus Pacearchaeota archaeon]